MMTLALLLTAATGAWAQTGENIFQYCYDCQRSPAYPKTTASASLSGFKNPYVSYSANPGTQGSTSAGPWKLEYMGLWSTTDKYGIDDVSYYQSTYNCTDVPVFRLYQWNATANEYQHAAYGVVCCYAKVSNAADHTALFEAGGHWGCVLTNTSHSSSMNITFDEDLTTGLTTLMAAATPAASGTPVALTWDAATPNTATLTNGMPAGNVTVSVEYFPQATAEGAVTAATGVKATTEDALVTIDKNKLTGVAKMMYYVSADAEATAPAYDAEGWTDKVPTAENYKQAADLKVWYYPVGTDEGVDEATATYSDGDMNATALAVSLGDAPTYDVTLNAEGLSTDEAAAWKVAKGDATPAAFPLKGVKKGDKVTVTYSSTRKVIGVKAEKKAKANIVDLSTISGDNYTVTGDVILTGTPTESPFDIIYGGDDYEVTLDNVNSAGSKQVLVDGNYHNMNIKLKGTSRLKEIFTNTGASNGNTVTIGEAAAGGTLILTGSTDPIRGKTLTINGGTVKSQATGDNWAVYLNNTVGVLTINGGALYLAAGEDGTQAVKGTVSGTLYGWNGSAWVTYTDQRYATTDNTSGNPTEWTW